MQVYSLYQTQNNDHTRIYNLEKRELLLILYFFFQISKLKNAISSSMARWIRQRYGLTGKRQPSNLKTNKNEKQNSTQYKPNLSKWNL